MRWIVLAALVLTALAGCVQTGGGDDFEVTCPNWWPAPDHFKGNSGFLHNATSSNEEWRQKNDHEKRVVHPGTAGGYTFKALKKEYHESGNQTDPETGEKFDFVHDPDDPRDGSVLDFYDLHLRTGAQLNGTFHPFGPIDARVIIEAHRAPRDENPRVPEGEEIDEPSGEVLLFEDLSTGQVTHQIVIEEEQVLDKEYRIWLTDKGQEPVDPASLRLDFYYFGDQDDDPETDSFAEVWMETERWYRHAACL